MPNRKGDRATTYRIMSTPEIRARDLVAVLAIGSELSKEDKLTVRNLLEQAQRLLGDD